MLGALALLLLLPSAASLQLPTMWASSMVVEADAPNALWGTDAPGALVSVSAFGATFNATADASGAFSLTLPAQPVSLSPQTIEVRSSAPGSAAVTLTDVLVGHTFVCSGQSNAEIAVGQTFQWRAETASADALGATLRLFQVAMLPEYCSTAAPQTNLTANLPWARASSLVVPGMSAMCYYFGAELVAKHPGVPIGLLASSWGGTAIQRASRARQQQQQRPLPSAPPSPCPLSLLSAAH